jgi:hypothetical protein
MQGRDGPEDMLFEELKMLVSVLHFVPITL